MKVHYMKSLDEKYYVGKSKNGIKIFYIPKENFSKQFAIFSTRYGSIDNKFTSNNGKVIDLPEGVAHFLEHKLFEEKDFSIDEEFAKIGAMVNAFTKADQTSYLFSSTENFYEGLELLIKFVQNPYLTEENVNKEKGIIEQEIKMYDDDPHWRVYFNCLNAMYKEHPVKIDIAGTVESIYEIDKDILLEAYNTFYHPSNMVLFISGDLNPAEIISRVNKVERQDYEKKSNINRIITKEPIEINKKYFKDYMETSRPLFHIGFKETKIDNDGRKRIKKEIETELLLDSLFGESSKFYNELYDSSLIDSSFGYFFTISETFGHTIIVGQSKNPKEVYNQILKLIERDIRDLITEEDFIRVKNNKLGTFLLSLDSIEYLATRGTDLYFNDMDFNSYYELLLGITYEDIEKRFKEHLIKENSVLSLVESGNK